MTGVALVVFGVAALGLAYPYLIYPGALVVLGWLDGEGRAERPDASARWPTVSISLPAYNESHQIADVIESLLRLDYPRDRLQILVVSDASTDGTDEIVRSYEAEGVELLRLPERGGKGAAENFAAPHLAGEIVVNTDASIRIPPESLKKLVVHFADPEIALASGRDVSVSAADEDANLGEAGYVGYEMAVRDLETRAGSIVGASGCFYAIRTDLHRIPLPDGLSRDFAAAIHAREHGFRAISVPGAICFVPRTGSLEGEYRRKVRTLARGMETLIHKRSALDPFRTGRFAWMLFSHKVCRWLTPWLGLAGLAALVVLAAAGSTWATWGLGAAGVALGIGGAGWALAGKVPLPRLVSVPAYGLMANVAALHATAEALSGSGHALWEPTRREAPS